MARSRFVLRYQGTGPAPGADLARIAALSRAVILDASPRMLLVEADADALGALAATLADWVMAPEQHLPLPDTRQRADHAPPVPEP